MAWSFGSGKADKAADKAAEARGAALEQFFAEGEAAIAECNNEHAFKKAAEQKKGGKSS